MLSKVLLVCGLAFAHGEEAFEWAGIFSTSAATYTWTAQKVNGAYAASTMKMVVLPATTITEAALHLLETEAGHGFAATCTVVEPTETITAMEDACYELHMEGATQSTFTIATGGASGIAIFTEHLPSEFEDDTHYLRSLGGSDVDPVATIDESTSHDDHDHDDDDDDDDHDDHDHDDDDDEPCFPSSAKVTKSDGSAALISSLKEGDVIVAATDDGKLTTDTVSLLSIADPQGSSPMVALRTANHTLTLTLEHHLPVGTSCCSELKQAKDVVVGDLVWTVPAGTPPVATKVLAKSDVKALGLHSPVLTNGGFPIVDGLVTSFDSIGKVTLAKHGLSALIAACKATNTCDRFKRTFHR